VGEVNAFIAELTPNFVDAVEATDDQLLKGRREGGREG
jgi:hypothetical protein